MGWIDELLKLSQLPQQSKRAARMYEELPQIAKAYTPESVAQALEYANEGQIMAMRPQQFRELSLYLPKEQSDPYVAHYAQLLKDGQWSEPPDGLFMEHYLNTIRNKPFNGFSDVPFLQYKQDPTSKIRGQIVGHEGRHRNLAVEDVFGPDLEWPVRFSKAKDRLPASPMLVYPEGGIKGAVDLSRNKRYAGGGLISPLRQMMWRGRSSLTPIEERAMHMSPQKQYGEEYARRRAEQLGGKPELDAYFVDPGAERRGHNITPAQGGNRISRIAVPTAEESDFLSTSPVNLHLFHGGRKFDEWNPKTIGSGEGTRFMAQGPGLYAGNKPELARRYLRYGGEDPQLSMLEVDPTRIIQPAKKMTEEEREIYHRAVAAMDKMGLRASQSGLPNAFLNGRSYNPQEARQALAEAGLGGLKQHLNDDFGSEFAIFDPTIIKSITPAKKRGGLVQMKECSCGS